MRAVFLLEQPDGVDRIGLSGPADLDIGYGEEGLRRNRQSDHLVTVLGGSEVAIFFMRGIACRNEQDLVEAERLAGLPGNRQMTVVNGIEGSAEQAEVHERPVVNEKC